MGIRRVLLTAALAALLPATALAQVTVVPYGPHEDRLISPDPAATGLGQLGGFTAWTAPTPDGAAWQVVLHDPEGRTQVLPIAPLAVPTTVSMSITAAAPGATDLHRLVWYTRCAGTSATAGCDVYHYDLATGYEKKAAGLSKAGVSESATARGVAVVRRGGAHRGTYRVQRHDGRVTLERLDRHAAREIAASASIERRIAMIVRAPDGRDAIVVSRGRAKPQLVATAPAGAAFALYVTRYRVGWLERTDAGVLIRRTTRIERGSGAPVVQTATRILDPSVRSASDDGSLLDTFADASGIHQLGDVLSYTG